MIFGFFSYFDQMMIFWTYKSGERLGFLLDVGGVPEDDRADDSPDVLLGPHAQQNSLRPATPLGPQICKTRNLKPNQMSAAFFFLIFTSPL